MLVSAEGEYSLSAGIVYDLPEALAQSLVDSGAALIPEPGCYGTAEKPAGNAPAPHHEPGYAEFTETQSAQDAANAGEEAGAGAPAPKPKPKQKAAPKRKR